MLFILTSWTILFNNISVQHTAIAEKYLIYFHASLISYENHYSTGQIISFLGYALLDTGTLRNAIIVTQDKPVLVTFL
jgi:hypothetical protein